MSVRTLTGVGAAVGLGILIALFPRTSDQGKTAPVGAVERQSPIKAMPSSDGLGSDPERVAHPVWRIVDPRAVRGAPPFAAAWSPDGRALVDVTAVSQEAPTWQVGERLAVEVPQLGGVREWTVERIDAGQDGRSRSVRGWIDGERQSRRIVVTVGPERVLAYIDTPIGPVELTGNARLAWMLPSSSMMASVDFSRPDYILPERRGRGHEAQ